MRTTLRCSLLVALVVFSCGEVAAQSLRGSRTSVNRIYSQANRHDLHFYQTADGIRRAGVRGEFVRLTGNSNYETANVSYPYVLPETHVFVQRLAAQYRAACGEKMVVTSAVRPTSMRLRNSVDKSVHPTGMAVDLRKPNNSRCRTWLRNTLVALEATGVLDAVEEHHPPHFHVAVFPSQYESYVQQRTGDTRRFAAAVTQPAPSSDEPTRYRVRSGDSLWTIARRNGTTVDEIKAANALRTSKILAGQVLVIPVAR